MPQISKVKTFFGGVEFDRIISVNGSGMFSCPLPSFATERLGYETVSGETKQMVERKFKEANDLYVSMQCVVKRVIVYSAKVSAFIKTKDGSRALVNRKDVSFTSGLAADIYAVVCDEKAFTSAKGFTTYRYEIIASTIPESMQLEERRLGGGRDRETSQMDWTQQREDFFAKLGVAMEQVVLSLNTLDKKDDAIALADNPKHKLLSS